MIQLRECALLDRKPFAPRWRKPCVAQNFDRDLIFQILAFREIHDSLSTVAEHFLEAVRSKLLQRKGSLIIILEDFVRHLRNIAVQKRSARRVLLQESHHFANQNYIIAAATFQATRCSSAGRSATS